MGTFVAKGGYRDEWYRPCGESAFASVSHFADDAARLEGLIELYVSGDGMTEAGRRVLRERFGDRVILVE
jgi:hypothetical protein